MEFSLVSLPFSVFFQWSLDQQSILPTMIGLKQKSINVISGQKNIPAIRPIMKVKIDSKYFTSVSVVIPRSASISNQSWQKQRLNQDTPVNFQTWIFACMQISSSKKVFWLEKGNKEWPSKTREDPPWLNDWLRIQKVGSYFFFYVWLHI